MNRLRSAEYLHRKLRGQNLYVPAGRYVFQLNPRSGQCLSHSVGIANLQRGTGHTTEVFTAIRHQNSIAVACIFRSHAQKVKAVQHDGIHTVKHCGVTGNHNAVRLDGIDHILQQRTGGLLKIYRQLQLFRDIHRQRGLNLPCLGVNRGLVNDLPVFII